MGTLQFAVRIQNSRMTQNKENKRAKGPLKITKPQHALTKPGKILHVLTSRETCLF